MPTEAQMKANRENAKKSCGPRTEAGKQKSRFNALKHGMRARSIDLVLPHEDPALLEAKVQEWMDDYQPANAIEAELVSRAARLSWVLDRAERHETALVSRRIRRAMIRSRGKRVEQVCELARKLFFMATIQDLPNYTPGWKDNPAAFVAQLEETSEGARWLRDRWIEMRCLMIADEGWSFNDEFKLVRLLGKHPSNAIDDPELNELFLAWETIEVDWGVRFWKHMQRFTLYQDPAFSAFRQWREIVPRPGSPEAAVAFLRGIADRAIERLDELIDDLEEIEEGDALELAEQAAFLNTDAGERLRRFVTARTRELHRTIDLLAKLRKADADARARAAKEDRKPTNGPKLPAPPRPRPQSTPYPTDPIRAIISADAFEFLDRVLQADDDPKPAPQRGANEAKTPIPTGG
jgi:hypothetical protein